MTEKWDATAVRSFYTAVYLRGVAALAIWSFRCYVASCRSTCQWGCFTSCLSEWRSHTHTRSSFSWRDTSSPQCCYPWESWMSEWNCAGWDNSDLCVLSLVVGKGRQLAFNMFALVLRSLADAKVYNWMCLWWKTLSHMVLVSEKWLSCDAMFCLILLSFFESFSKSCVCVSVFGTGWLEPGQPLAELLNLLSLSLLMFFCFLFFLEYDL